MPSSTSAPAPGAEGGRFLRRGALFVLLGIVLYGALYVGSEALVRRTALRNPFFRVQSADHQLYDHVILGASHSAVLAYRDLNERLETASGATVLNLSTPGAGIELNRALLEYFFARRDARTVVYVVDSFGFYSSTWNEERLADAQLVARAPWDPTLAGVLLRSPASRLLAVDYALGFSKINNPERLEPDSFPGEGARFERTYRPVEQIDRQRIAFLYPEGADTGSPEARRYLGAFEDLIGYSRSNGARVLVVRPPLPARMRERLPGEDEFEEILDALLRRLDVRLHDFSRVNNDEALFYDPDHLNREGAIRFIDDHLAPLLASLP